MRLLVQTGLCFVLLWFGLLGHAVPYSAAEAKEADKVKPTVYLTFDDGPSLHTKEVLAILKREGVKGTFFMLGKEVKRHPAIAKQVVQEGHAIGNHSYDHVYEELYSSFTTFAKQTMDTDDEIYKATGVRTNLVRAPGGTFGNFDQGYFDALAKAGYIVNDWNVDSGDSTRLNVPASEIISTVEGSRLTSKVVVLMHDSSIHGESVKALPEVIAFFKKKGYQFAVLTDQVKPIQFRVAESMKWKRPKVTAAETQTLVQYMARTRTPVEAPKQQSLVVHAGGNEILFAPTDYSMRNGTIEVPLRQLTIGLKGIIRLDMPNGIVEAMVNNQSAGWTASEVGGSGRMFPNRIMVPLRDTLQRFDYSISRIAVTTDKREIWADSVSI